MTIPIFARAATLGIAILSSVVGCSSSDADQVPNGVTIDITVVDAVPPVIPHATYQVLAVFQGTCPPTDSLANGNLADAQSVQVFASGASLPATLTLPSAKYGLAYLVRDDKCAVTGFGCVPVDLAIHKHATISVQAIPSLGACESGKSCVDGRCQP